MLLKFLSHWERNFLIKLRNEFYKIIFRETQKSNERLFSFSTVFFWKCASEPCPVVDCTILTSSLQISHPLIFLCRATNSLSWITHHSYVSILHINTVTWASHFHGLRSYMSSLLCSLKLRKQLYPAPHFTLIFSF